MSYASAATPKDNPTGLKGTVSEHTHHAANSPGSQCTACHMPNIAETLGNKQDGSLYVASHTFRFITPTLTEKSRIPNPCTGCHKDKMNSWVCCRLLPLAGRPPHPPDRRGSHSLSYDAEVCMGLSALTGFLVLRIRVLRIT